MASPKKTLVFQRLTLPGLAIALFWRLFGYDAACLHVAKALDGPLGRRVLTWFDIDKLDLAKLPWDSPYSPYAISHRLACLVMAALYPEDRAFQAVLPGFTGVSDPQAVKIVIHDRICAQLEPLASLLAVAESLAAASGARPCLFAPLSGLEHLALRLGRPGATNACPPFASACARAAKAIAALLRRLPRLVQASRAPALAGDAGAEERETDPATFEVLFFPHQSPAYGALFLKDYYYAPDPDSPLARENILHVEYGSAHLASSLAYYRAHRLHHAVLGRCTPRQLAGHAATGLWACARAGRRFLATLGAPRSIGLGQLLYAMVAYGRYRAAVAPFRKARLAIAGYDLLFPRCLALALMSRGVRVVAAQERFLQAFFPHFTALFDLYLVAGPRVIAQVAANPLCRIGELRAIGCTRSDLLAGDGAAPHDVPRVLVLDFHSPGSCEESRLAPLVNWENNRAFYRDIIRLARRFPQVRFTIRGKNDAWCSLPFFAETRDAINRLGNVEINHDYDRLNVSYSLAREADLILARHTSLGDEALACGIPVLFHDYAPNCPKIIASLFDYEGYPVFVHGYAELEQRMAAFLDGDPLMPPESFARMRQEFYAAGHTPVRERLLAELRRLLAES